MDQEFFESTPMAIRALRASTIQSDSAKDAQIARFKERVRALEAQVRSLKEENELLYRKLTREKLFP